MSYAALNTIFLVAAALFSCVAYLVSARRGAQINKAVVIALSVTALVMLITTALFDNVIIGSGLVAYDSTTLLGGFIGVAPVEDFGYTIAAVLILPALWIVLGTRKKP